jgi:hypothetical protein
MQVQRCAYRADPVLRFSDSFTFQNAHRSEEKSNGYRCQNGLVQIHLYALSATGDHFSAAGNTYSINQSTGGRFELQIVEHLVPFCYDRREQGT